MSDQGPYRPVTPADQARIARLWRGGASAFHIATTLKLAYGVVNDQVAQLDAADVAELEQGAEAQDERGARRAAWRAQEGRARS